MPMLIQISKKPRKRETHGGGSVSAVLPHELVAEELLTRLPANSLMRFKCVSKLWRSTIADPSFCKAHRTARSCSRRGLLMVRPDINSPVSGLGFFLYANYGASVLESLHPFTVGGGGGGLVKKKRNKVGVLELLHQFNVRGDGVTEVVNGLFCMYTDCRARICNVSTGEIMELPSPPPKKHKSFKHCKCHLGFDLARNQYKLLKVCSFQRMNDCVRCISECEILTLGKDAAWRSIQLVDGTMDTRRLQSVYIHAHVSIGGMLPDMVSLLSLLKMRFFYRWFPNHQFCASRVHYFNLETIWPWQLVLAVSNKHTYMFSAGDDKQVKCWDLEQNKGFAILYPRSGIFKMQIHAQSGHENTVCSVLLHLRLVGQ
ncbi:hypothetical protein RHMOL_Rhmol08G0038800 [Rhododendron molle]|uniref:Uncharacterized protein n=1 Tax=Rhododendron molle TaxID=49168 RepID=A0ACC0MLB5_RHOML|nr:hypothetical protein RHMOL_Rhmol08G0038800 [Rhododendron molle]